jgi:heme-degrading monooxygenase HmoA
MFIVMNRFKVRSGREADFEAMWRRRETSLSEFEGFVQFALLRNEVARDEDGTTEFISHTTWRSRADFEAWRDSEAFHRVHAQGTVEGVLAGPPQASLYEGVIMQTRAGAGLAAVPA